LPAKRLHTIALVIQPKAIYDPQRIPFPDLFLQVTSPA
jgi:hypothetical protein